MVILTPGVERITLRSTGCGPPIETWALIRSIPAQLYLYSVVLLTVRTAVLLLHCVGATSNTTTAATVVVLVLNDCVILAVLLCCPLFCVECPWHRTIKRRF